MNYFLFILTSVFLKSFLLLDRVYMPEQRLLIVMCKDQTNGSRIPHRYWYLLKIFNSILMGKCLTKLITNGVAWHFPFNSVRAFLYPYGCSYILFPFDLFSQKIHLHKNETIQITGERFWKNSPF